MKRRELFTTVPALAAPRHWARQLEPAQLRTIQELARAETTRLVLMIDDVAEMAIPEEGPWQSQWLDVCHGRDDLEGVCTLLREANAVDPLTEPLEVRRRISVVIQESAADLFLSVVDNFATFGRFHGLASRVIRERIDGHSVTG